MTETKSKSKSPKTDDAVSTSDTPNRIGVPWTDYHPWAQFLLWITIGPFIVIGTMVGDCITIAVDSFNGSRKNGDKDYLAFVSLVVIVGGVLLCVSRGVIPRNLPWGSISLYVVGVSMIVALISKLWTSPKNDRKDLVSSDRVLLPASLCLLAVMVVGGLILTSEINRTVQTTVVEAETPLTDDLVLMSCKADYKGWLRTSSMECVIQDTVNKKERTLSITGRYRSESSFREDYNGRFSKGVHDILVDYVNPRYVPLLDDSTHLAMAHQICFPPNPDLKKVAHEAPVQPAD